MPYYKKKEDFFSVEQDEQTFNVAGGFVILKILKPMVECDKYEMIAIYGTENMETSITLSPPERNYYRAEALRRLKDTLLVIIENTEFKIKGSRFIWNADNFRTYKTRLSLVSKYINNVTYENVNQLTKQKELLINEDLFDTILEILRDVKTNMNKEINESDLIFKQIEALDIDKVTKRIEEGF